MSKEEGNSPSVMTEGAVLLVYQTNYETLRAESFLRDKMLRVKPVIKPTKIRSACGMALQVSLSVVKEVCLINEKEKLNFVGFFRREENSKQWKKYSF